MIEAIKNYTYKSFKNYSTPEKFFKQKNILFGYNGRGKSSLSKGIVEEYSKKDTTEESIRFFNRDYVKNRLLLDNSDSTIKGIKVSFSKKDADIAKEIAELQKQIEDVTERKKKNNQNRQSIREKIDSIHDNKKGTANINKKQSKLKVEEVIEQYSADLKNALKMNNREYIKKFTANSDELEKEKDRITKTQLPDLKIQEIPIDDKVFLFDALQKKYILTGDIPTSEVIRWLEKGVSLHDESDTICKFCHNNFNLEDVKNSIRKYKEDSKQKDIFRLETIKECLDSNIKNIDNAERIKGNLFVLGCSEEEIDKIFNFDYLEYTTHLIEEIERKILNMDKSIEIEDYILEFEKEVSKKSKEIQDIHKKKLDEINTSIGNIERIAKGTIAIAIEESNILEELKNIQKNEAEIEGIENKNEELLGEIRTLEESKSEYIDFMNFLNEVLSSLGIQITLSLKDNNYYLRHTLEDCDLTIDNISEGEKNLLALLYFYFELYSDKEQKKFKPEIKLVVIDDPISSLDDSNKFYVLEIVKKILSEKFPQIFLLTHSWNDFCQITYGIKTADTNYGIFEIYKNSSNNFYSEIRTCQGNIAPYKKLFQEIYILKDKYTDELEQCEIYHAANSMRRIFEEFLNFKKTNLLPQKSNQAEIESLYYEATGKTLGNNKKRKLGELLTFINVLSHRPIRADEIVQNSKTLMQIIESMDKVHFNEMKK